MPAVGNSRGRDTQLTFEAIVIEGGLFSPEWLARVVLLEAGDQGEGDYGVPKGLNLRDEIGRYWRIAQAHWADFAAGRATGADAQTLSRTFVPALLRDSFGFGSLVERQAERIADRHYPISFAALESRVPIVIAPAGGGLEAAAAAFGDGTRRRSPFGLLQEYLNAAAAARWGIATDGVTLRIGRDNASLTRPAWIEADLGRIFAEGRYADFAALWLLAHQTRFGKPAEPVDSCPLERWREAGREEGTRAREHLRAGVEQALLALGHGFLTHPENHMLRKSLQDGTLTRMAYFQELLRLVYRLIFLLTIEERRLLHPSDVSDTAKELYSSGYSVSRLRDRSVKRSAHDRFADLWEGAKIVFKALAIGEPRLGLPALSGLFDAEQCPNVDRARLENRALLLAIFRLGWLRASSGLARVNWRDMGPEELGSVYESLLELVPQIPQDGRHFTFATGGETKGHARKTTGSYYTPDTLVQVLLDSALEPVVKNTIAAHPKNPVAALLQLSIVDPACGSGHFLLAAARRLAAHVARLRANGTPSVGEYQHALREVVGRCIHGVDLNPMAVELCRASLWMEAVDPGLPLTFLDSHIQQGNALLGTTPELMARGIPDEAWNPIEGDDRKVASALKRRNKAEREGQRSLIERWTETADTVSDELLKAVSAVESAPDSDMPALARKRTAWQAVVDSDGYRHQRLVADAWCAAFVWPKQPGPTADFAPTHQQWQHLRDPGFAAPALTVQIATELAGQCRFFHWHLQFPQVFARGGFDVVLGNPPWERIKLQEQEFFASRHDGIAVAPNAAARKKLVSALAQSDPVLWNEWCAASRRAEGESHFVRASGKYPLCGKGDVNTYALFAEHNRGSLTPHGRAGFIVPSGIATDDTTKEFFGALIVNSQLVSLLDFQSGPGFFGEIGHARFKFCLLTLGPHVGKADLLFFARSIAELSEPDRHVSLDETDFETLNPNTRTCPTFRSRRDATINLAIYRRAGVLWREDHDQGNPWHLRFMAMFHMANDSGVFRSADELESEDEYLPLIEAKMVHHFDHRYGDYADKPSGSESTILPEVPVERLQDPSYRPTPRYWVTQHQVEERLAPRWNHGWLLGWRDICRSFDERTVIASVISRMAVGHKLPLMMPSTEGPLASCLYANLCSFVLDYASRQKVGGASLTYFILKQLPVLAPKVYEVEAWWSPPTSVRDWLVPRVLELTYTAWDLEPFALDVGYDGPPFRWDSQRRFLLRCELDAAFAHLYGLSRDDTAYVIDTFPIVKKNDEKSHGEYRTKRIILEVYDEIADAARTGQPYVTRLVPPPADPRIAHRDDRIAVV
jgi:hypothetical protein